MFNSKQSEAEDHERKCHSPVQFDACLLLPHYFYGIFLLLDHSYFLFPYHKILFWFHFYILTSRIYTLCIGCQTSKSRCLTWFLCWYIQSLRKPELVILLKPSVHHIHRPDPNADSGAVSDTYKPIQ
jgi:hypothetical protein